MVDPTPNEIAAMESAAERGGEFLDSINKSDLATMDQSEWMTFIECVCTGYVERLGAIGAANDAPARPGSFV